MRNARVEPRFWTGGQFRANRIRRRHGNYHDPNGGQRIGRSLWRQLPLLQASRARSLAQSLRTFVAASYPLVSIFPTRRIIHCKFGSRENGTLSSLSPGITGNQVTLPWTFGLDGAGRPFSEANPNGSILQSTTYNPDGTIARLTHANGDNEVYSYQNGRMTQYQFNIGATPTSLVGTLTWNPNGTLQMLGLNDGFNSSNTQTCTYSHDDLSRIAAVNCTKSGGTNVWNQQFNYDAFGNITKSVPTGGTGISFAPGYDPATNHYLGVTYTAGNPGNDGVHSYTWDANWSTIASIDTTTVIHDALGRIAEQQNGTTSTQVMYGPTGKLALMNGQTEIQSFQPFPGGGVFVHRPGSLTNYWRHPNVLGSSRLATTLPGRIKFYDVAYAPFGEDYNGSGTTDLDFTGQTQDTTSTVGGLYDFLFREYAGRQGRWISPDPAGLAAVDIANPQTWNRYAYVGNNPCSGTDPLGLADCNLTIGGNISLPPVAEAELARIYAAIGVTISFVPGLDANALLLQNVPVGVYGYHPAGTNVAQVDNPRIADGATFYSPYYAPTDPSYYGYPTGLGRAIAHEIGHIFLGDPHAASGIMRPGESQIWSDDPAIIGKDLFNPFDASKFFFTAGQAAQIRNKLGCDKKKKEGNGGGGGGDRGGHILYGDGGSDLGSSGFGDWVNSITTRSMEVVTHYIYW
jgi:RHS repeat-associated protein